MTGFYLKPNTGLNWVNIANNDFVDQELVQNSIIITLFYCFYFEQGFGIDFFPFLFATVIW